MNCFCCSWFSTLARYNKEIKPLTLDRLPEPSHKIQGSGLRGDNIVYLQEFF